MKWLIASDIHGSEFYCRRLIEAYEREKADRLLLLGDLLYHGPRNDLPKDYAPKKVMEMLNSLKCEIFCVRGNCEAEVDQMVLEFPVMAEYALIPLDSFGISSKTIIFATHGHLFNKDKLPPLKNGDILLYGHTHVPICETVALPQISEAGKPENRVICMNPGSVSIPKNDSCHSYMTMEEGDRNDFDTSDTRKADKEARGIVFKWKSLDGEVYKEYSI